MGRKGLIQQACVAQTLHISKKSLFWGWSLGGFLECNLGAFVIFSLIRVSLVPEALSHAVLVWPGKFILTRWFTMNACFALVVARVWVTEAVPGPWGRSWTLRTLHAHLADPQPKPQTPRLVGGFLGSQHPTLTVMYHCCPRVTAREGVWRLVPGPSLSASLCLFSLLIVTCTFHSSKPKLCA